jgi:hypothetical protein
MYDMMFGWMEGIFEFEYIAAGEIKLSWLIIQDLPT